PCPLHRGLRTTHRADLPRLSPSPAAHSGEVAHVVADVLRDGLPGPARRRPPPSTPLRDPSHTPPLPAITAVLDTDPAVTTTSIALFSHTCRKMQRNRWIHLRSSAKVLSSDSGHTFGSSYLTGP